MTAKNMLFFLFVLLSTFCKYIYMEEAGSVQITTDPDPGCPKKTYGSGSGTLIDSYGICPKAKTVFRN
jgi:hypothetical protein